MRWIAALTLLIGGCLLEVGKKPCTAAADCTLPYVCCTSGVGLQTQGFTAPHCLSRLECGPGNFLSILADGDPCGRVPDGYACGAGLVCCDKSMTCRAEAACATADLPSAAPVADAACSADVECGAGICCGIDFDDRDGRCRTVDACLAEVGRTLPRPDGGVGDGGAPDGGSAALAQAICAEAFCDTPDAARLARCEEALAFGAEGYRPSPACLAAVTESRPLCPYALQLRAGVDPARFPIPPLPDPCLAAPPAAHAEAAAACAKLAECGVFADPARCAALIGGRPYDTLSRISGTDGCAFDLPRLGFRPIDVTSRCASDADCPADGWTCEVSATRYGLCRMRSCEPQRCALAGGTCDAAVCAARCNPGSLLPNPSSLAGQCGGRIDYSGRTQEMACLQSGGSVGATSGFCVPWPDQRACDGSIETLRFEGRYRSAGGTMCTDTATGALPLYALCSPSSGVAPDPCAEGYCDPTYRACAYPCVVVGAGATSAACGPREACVQGYGWGSPGFCHPRCGSNAECPSGRCLEDPLGGRFCSAR